MPRKVLILFLLAVFRLSIGLVVGGVGAQEEELPLAEEPAFTATATRYPLEARYTLPITDDVTYTIQVRDTLDGVAAGFDINLLCLFETNNLRGSEIIQPGDEILISADCPPYQGGAPVLNPRTDAPGRSVEGGTYIVQQNDTLETIAQSLDISIVSLQQANDLDNPNRLSVGDVLAIPEDAPPYGSVPASTDETLEERQTRGGAGGTTYVVQPNDTLDTIGQALDVSVEQLIQVNNIENPRLILPGLELVIPENPAPYGTFPALDTETNQQTQTRLQSGELRGESYVVQPNDTLDTIAQEFNVSVVAIREANEIDSVLDLRPGTTLVIPQDAPVYGFVPSSGQPAGSQIAAGREYIIQAGDTLDGIAAQFNIDTLCLIERNGIDDPRFIYIGEIVGIPADCPEYTGFDVVPDNPPTEIPRVQRSTGGEAATQAASPTVEAVEATPTPTLTITPEAATEEPLPTEEAQGTEEVAAG